MEHGPKLYAAKTVSWPGATPFCPPVCGPNPLRGFGGHARPRYTRSARSFGILPRTNIQGRAWNSSNIVCRARVSTTKEVPLLKSPEPANRHAKVLRPHQGTSGAEDEALRRVPGNRHRHLDNVVRRICQTMTSTYAASRPDCFQPHEPFGVPMHSINRKPPMKLIRHDPLFEPLLDSDEAVRLLRIHPKTLQKMARDGEITGIQIGKLCGSAPLISTSGFTRLQVDNACDSGRAIFTRIKATLPARLRARRSIFACRRRRALSASREAVVKICVYFTRHCFHGATGAALIAPFSSLLSGGHGRLSTSPAPWRRSALLLPLRGPPGFRFPPKKIGPAEQPSFPGPPENAELGLGSRCHLPLGAPQE